MKRNPAYISKHAVSRSQQRSIPLDVVDVLLEYGESVLARDGARKIGLSRKSYAELKNDFGVSVSRSFERYRNAYVVLCEGSVLTVARASKPLFH